MKRYIYLLLISVAVLSTNSCEDYLDIVPDERPTDEDAFRTPQAALGYLYSCYGYIPSMREGTGSLDLMTADEIVTAFEHELFAQFPRGQYSASNPVISYWDDLYKGIRQSYILIDRIDGVEGLSQSEKDLYKAEANFLIGYFHFLLLRMYGPVVIAEQQFDLNMPTTEYPLRSTYEEGVAFVVEKMDEAAQALPAQHASGSNYGRATSVIAKAVKSRLLLYAASPLFNGGGKDKSSFFTGFVDQDGQQLISTTYDESKWQRAAVAAKEAIDAAEASGHRLYANSTQSGLPSDPIEKDLRYVFVDRDTDEVIWGDTRPEGAYAFQNKSTPFVPGNAWNGVSPTLTMLEMFYTKNGLPIDRDPNWDYNGRYKIAANQQGPTLALNLEREPRFEAWISYHNDYYEVIRGSDEEVLTQYRKNDAYGIQGRTNNYAPTGYLNKKGVAPQLEQSTFRNPSEQYPWPVFRLAELYLNYAEALIESGGDLATAKNYIDRVRTRAGIPTIDEAWEPIGGANTQDVLREIVRQERTIELYLENHRFWDLRRWQIADQYLDDNAQGLNIQGVTDEEFFQISEVPFPRSFSQRNYLMPIPQAEINKNELLIQNPGY